MKSNLDYIYSVVKDSGSYSDEEAKEISFHLSEIIPDFEMLMKKISEKNLIMDDVLNIMVHIPYHVKSADSLIFKK